MAAPPLGDEIKAQAVQRRRPDGSGYLGLRLAKALDLARRKNLSLRQVETAALAERILPERYARNTQSLTIADQQTLLESKAAIIGVGGLGGTAAEVLARIGIGGLHLIDGDCFEEHNLNRQRFAHTGNLRQPKTQAAREQIAQINPAVSVKTSTVFLDETNAASLIADAQVVIDCLDRLDSRLVLQKACRRLQIPLVSAAVAGTTAQLTVIFPEDIGLESLIGDITEANTRGVETHLGNLPFTVSTVASLEAAEAVKVLLGREGLLRNRLLLIDLMEPYFEIIRLG